MLFEGFVENIELKRQSMRNKARRGDCSYWYHIIEAILFDCQARVVRNICFGIYDF